MKILLINHYAGSPRLGMEYRPYYMAREWTKLGHEVMIVAASHSHVRSRQPVVGKSLEVHVEDGINYCWIKTEAYQGNNFSRIKNMALFVWGLWRHQKSLAQWSPDVVIGSSTYPLDMIPASRIAKIAGARLIFEVHDLWPLSPMELGGYSKWHPFIMVMQFFENFAYRNCHSVVSMLPKALDHMVKHGLKPEKFFYVPNGIVIEEWKNPEKISAINKRQVSAFKKKFPVLIGYTGSHGLANALEDFILSAEILKNDKTGFVLVGDGPDKKRLQNLAEEKKLKNILFLDPVPKRAIPDLLKLFDVLFIGFRRQSLYRFGISPNKLMDYMMAAQPVLLAVEAGNDLVAESNCGISVEPENIEAIVGGIRKLISLNAKQREKLGQNGKKYVLKNHDYKILAKKFLDAMG